SDVLRHAFERHAPRDLSGLLERRAPGAHAKGLDVDRWPAFEALRARVGAGERDAGLDAPLERRGARRVVAAERDAPDAGAPGIDVAARLQPVEHGLHRRFVLRADGEVVLGLALARAVEGERRYAAREETVLVVVH